MRRAVFDTKPSNEEFELSKEDNNPGKSNLIESIPFVNNNRTPDVAVYKPPTFLENLSYYFSQFCGSTSIHGVQYVGERGRYCIEKIIWTIIISMVGSICIFLILQAYNKWVTSPVIVSFSTTEMPIWKIPFPAVTICPEVKSDPTIFNITNVLLRKLVHDDFLDDEEKQLFDTFALICTGCLKMFGTDRLKKKLNDSLFIDLFAALPDFDPINVTTIKWLGQTLAFEDALTYSITSEGICYSFNMLDYEEIFRDSDDYIDNLQNDMKVQSWSLENGYADSNTFDSFPRRTFVSGIEGGLEIDGLFTNHSHLDYICKESLQGYKVVLHHPTELPNMDRHFRVPLDEAVIVGIKPRMITVSPNLLSYSPDARKCYFSHEKQLSIFKIYTQENCLTECLANYTISACGCSPIYINANSDILYCGAGHDNCTKSSKVSFLLNEIQSKTCNCLPSCTGLEYDIEITQTPWNWHEVFEMFKRLGIHEEFAEFDSAHLSRLNVFYKEMQFLTSERNELYGYVDFFSNTGGLLGLFIGFSVTSAIEILYYLTVRIICNIKKYGKDVWSGEPELVNAKNAHD